MCRRHRLLRGRGELIERSKDALDEIYTEGSAESERVLTALEVYGSEKFAQEFKFCVDEILKVCSAGGGAKLRDVVFRGGQTNAFPSVFAVLLIGFHELIVCEGKFVADYDAVKRCLQGLSKRFDTSRKATSIEERRRNIDSIKGMISAGFVDAKPPPAIYGSHTTMDIESIVRRSEIEVGNYELKQGMLSLYDGSVDAGLTEKIVKTICAIANNGPFVGGTIIVGVTDKDADAQRVRELRYVDSGSSRWPKGGLPRSPGG